MSGRGFFVYLEELSIGFHHKKTAWQLYLGADIVRGMGDPTHIEIELNREEGSFKIKPATRGNKLYGVVGFRSANSFSRRLSAKELGKAGMECRVRIFLKPCGDFAYMSDPNILEKQQEQSNAN